MTPPHTFFKFIFLKIDTIHVYPLNTFSSQPPSCPNFLENKGFIHKKLPSYTH